ncbi:DUF3618 domain-containing protein [Kibdelosporangium phytohabitans]|uniref:Cell division protein FtsB n=1 Tax=Kibdelosporangium phytohabitans TaxID=860235 RepID=A0A0N7F2Z3_9PSEU|nr:DUF3618 domain-containing protein [Kibdelosporangium phytohabitans]ALG07191.1 cell division protein FtsB [Kibdelosporangium phytohabitans]MBE1468528.1 hypothetical protein [Kibdelosporangium phytohabitans]
MARDPDTIQRDIEQARDALASTLDQLSEKANPKKLVDDATASVKSKFDDPRVKAALIGVGVLVAVVVVRRLFR